MMATYHPSPVPTNRLPMIIITMSGRCQKVFQLVRHQRGDHRSPHKAEKVMIPRPQPNRRKKKHRPGPRAIRVESGTPKIDRSSDRIFNEYHFFFLLFRSTWRPTTDPDAEQTKPTKPPRQPWGPRNAFHFVTASIDCDSLTKIVFPFSWRTRW